jgi:predicted dehydrogenase
MNVGIVGCGEISEVHSIIYRDLGLPLTAVCDVNENTAAKAAERWGVPTHYTDLSKMLKEENLSIISICTPPKHHAEAAVTALESGCNVVCEKPFTVTVKEADRVISKLRKSSAKLTVIQNQLFEQSMLRAMEQIQEGSIGRVVGMNVSSMHSKDEEITAKKDHWCHRLPGGRLGESLPHPVYLLQGVLGKLEVKSVFVDKLGDYPWMQFDQLGVVLEGDKKIGTIHINFATPEPKKDDVLADIYGANGAIHVGIYPVNTLIVTRPGRGIWLSENLTRQLKIGSSYLKTIITKRKGPKDFRPAHALIIKTFVESILDDTKPPVTVETAREHVRVVEQICEQIDSRANLKNDPQL